MATTYQEEHNARELNSFLEKRLASSPVSLKVGGAGVHWHVDASDGSRCARVHCFDYGERPNTLVLGLSGNAHLSKVRVGAPGDGRHGPEYFVDLQATGKTEATGRTQDINVLANVVADWVISRFDIHRMYERHAVVDEERRARIRVANAVNEHLETFASRARVSIEEGDWGRDTCELWFYDGDRSGKLVPQADGRVSCALLERRTQLLRVENWAIDDVGRLLRLWVDDDASVDSVHQQFPTAHAEPYAEAFGQGDYATWHWGNVIDQAAHGDILGFYQPLLDRIVRSDVIRPFFSFTSLYRLCLSRSSLYPFDTDGLPMITPERDLDEQRYAVCFDEARRMAGTERETCEFLEQALASETIVPYFGTIEDRLRDELNAELAANGSSLRAGSVQRLQWQRVVIENLAGKCELFACDRPARVGLRLLSGDESGTRFAGDPASAALQVMRWLQE